MSTLPPPLPDRECGACHVCCVEMKIDDVGLTKADGEVCPKLSGGRCTIYETRPTTCRTWFCGWRFMNLNDKLRPDRSGVLLIPEMGSTPGYEGKGGFAFAFLDTRPPSFKNNELVDLAAQLVARNLPLYLVYGAGGEAKRFLANDSVKLAVVAGDRTKFVQTLTAILDDMVAQVKALRAQKA